ncbi:MAG: beta-galactosidase [Kiritimatiellae bacterium]|nr:beta-galactosidase [Kiritimatiellia bacterium]
MKRSLLAVLLSLAFRLPAHAAPLAKPDWAGIWGIWGGETVSTEGKPWFKGTLVTVTWRQIEPADNQFNFRPLDERIQRAADKGLYVMCIVYHGTKTPEWAYEQGVPRVEVTNRNNTAYPYYLAPAFKRLLKRMIARTADHITKELPPDLRKRVIGVQGPAGKSGDPQPYQKGHAFDARYDINQSGEEWQAYNREIFQAYMEAYRGADPPIVPLLKPVPSTHEWLMQHGMPGWRKTFQVAQMYQMPGEEKLLWLRDLRLQSAAGPGPVIRLRGEFDHATGDPSAWFQEAPAWNMYWQCLWMLTYGVDIFNIRKEPLTDCAPYVEAFTFFTKYAGCLDPATSPGAWCALRDGLDIADTDRFPEDAFGKLNGIKSPDRYTNIARAFAPWGAVMGDAVAASTLDGLTYARTSKAMNDVACRVWRGNYALFMTQHDPLGTSQGHWRVGAKDQPYGRYARGFNHAAGQDAMCFRLADGFFGGEPLASRQPVRVRVVYFDKGTGSWALKYDGVDDPAKTACTVTKRDTGRWKEITVTLSDGHFGRRCPNGTDLMLVNTDAEDDIFHIVELTR